MLITCARRRESNPRIVAKQQQTPDTTVDRKTLFRQTRQTRVLDKGGRKRQADGKTDSQRVIGGEKLRGLLKLHCCSRLRGQNDR